MNTPAAKTESRSYRKRARAVTEEETRQRIVDAAIELHESEGFPGSSVSAIAERAGVGRVTVYRHFADYDEILQACTSHYMELHPPPQPSQWERVADRQDLLRVVVAESYDYFQANERMFTHGTADAVTLPYLAERMIEIGMYWVSVRDWLLARLLDHDSPTPEQRALTGLLLSFSGWQALVRQQQLSFEDAKITAISGFSAVLADCAQT